MPDSATAEIRQVRKRRRTGVCGSDAERAGPHHAVAAVRRGGAVPAAGRLSTTFALGGGLRAVWNGGFTLGTLGRQGLARA